MPMPLWWGHVNKRVFNPGVVRSGKRPVIRHTGRSSGRSYRTPLDAHEVDDGFIFILVYGSRSDWVQNILSAGTATLEVDGEEIALHSPVVIGTDEAWQQLPAGTTPPPKMLRIDEYLKMQRAA